MEDGSMLQHEESKSIQAPIVDIAEVFSCYSGMVYKLAYSRCAGNRADADDVFQEVFMRYVRRKPVFDSAEHQKAWLIRVTINCSNSLHTSSWRKKTCCINDITMSDSMSDTTADTNCETVYATVMKLPLKYRTVIHLFYYEGYHIDEIAKIMNAKVNTIKSWLKRAREKLAQDLKGEIFDV